MTEVVATNSNINTSTNSSRSILSANTTLVQYAFEAYLRSRHTRRQYTGSLKAFFAYLQLPGSTLEEQALAFLEKAAANKQWVEESIISFIIFQRQKAENREIAPGTVKNYYRPIKLLFNTYDDTLPTLSWKKISKVLVVYHHH